MIEERDLIEARDMALDDDMALDRALRIVRAFYEIYGSNAITAKYVRELADHLIGVKQNARRRHQEAEAVRIALED
jgi:hypothetical protein